MRIDASSPCANIASAVATTSENSGSSSAPPTRRVRHRTNYSVKKKREMIALAQVAGVRKVCQMEDLPRGTLRQWLREAEKINSFEGPDSRKSIGRSGRRELVPFGQELGAFLEQSRSLGKETTSSHMIEFIRENHGPWMKTYLADKKSAESGHAALTRLCQRFVERHGFSQPSITKTTTSKSSNMLSSEPQTSAKRSSEPMDDRPLLFGLDIGTTAVKCVLVHTESYQTVAVATVALSDVVEEPQGSRIGVQNVDQVLLAVQRAITLLPAQARQRAESIGICGQMHGIMWWCCRGVHDAAERLLTRKRHETDEVMWTELITWQDQRCSSSFLRRCRDKLAELKVAPLAAGYGLASFTHTLENSPRTLVGMDACGTIHDFVAFLLCGHSHPSETFIDTTNAHSWGGFDVKAKNWNARVLRALEIPLSMLPVVKTPGTRIGSSCAGQVGLGLPSNLPVYVPMGDHPCSVLAALAPNFMSATDRTLVNIGTSAQIAIVLTESDVARLDCTHSSFQVRPFLFDRYLGVAASLSGGNIFAWLVHQWQEWTDEMGLNKSEEAQVYAQLIKLGLARQETKLTFVPTIDGERIDQDASGKILNLRRNNWSMGDISAALSRGIIENLFGMIPDELQSLVMSQSMIGTGNALVRNELLQHFLKQRLAHSSQLHAQSEVDAAVGAAFIPLLGNNPLAELDTKR